ncbi:hypothetical protein [Alkalicoccobacillus plakortidis]|uniref:Uncharacterized protein n=1 Tax=Alkalicoccobacillus plakortidis TaxID=444060 RepID=A0ABT0XKF0_9BACI|nr:hypothetical protein [Alkalicoccobacillus plakortidis]MCM2676385.1 hypothetical protein [Alkalicoccobacillus plakortidis]
MSEVLTHWELIIDELQAMMTIDIQEIPKKVVFSNYGLNSLLTKDHMIYQTHSTTSVVDFNTSKDFEKNLIELMIPKRGNTELFFEWTNMTSQFIRGELNVEVEWPGLSVDAMGFDDDLETAFNQLYADFDALSIDVKRSFLDAWYTDMDESWTWIEVTSLMEEMKAQ